MLHTERLPHKRGSKGAHVVGKQVPRNAPKLIAFTFTVYDQLRFAVKELYLKLWPLCN